MVAHSATMSPCLSSSIPNSQTAIKIKGAGKAAVVECEIPTVNNDEVLIRVVCVALNPVDWKSADLSPALGATWGTDFSGEVVGVGEVFKKSFTLGEAVCGAAYGNNPDELTHGAFGEFVVMPGELIYKIPPGMSFEQAATVGTGLATAGLTLYHTLGLPWPLNPAEKPQHVLVYGGGTATGTMLIQLLRL